MTKVASFDIFFHQVLDEHGELKGPIPEFVNDLAVLRSLYKSMVLVRAYDTKAVALQRTGKMGTYAPVHGQEAIGTAIGHAMRKEDVLVPYYRDYAAQIQRGVKMSQIYQYWGGDERGSYFNEESEDFPICVPIATQCLHATGVAFAFKYRNQQRVAVSCIGEGGTSEGDFYEGINLAGSWQLPVVFVVNNNQWAISVPREQQTGSQTIAQKAIAAGIEGVQVDGNDIIALRETIGEKIEKARTGGGATVIEAITYRLCDHTTADDASRYQQDGLVADAKTKEPLKRFRKFLMANNYWDESREKALIAECKQKVDEAVNEYESLDTQEATSMFDYHYAELPDCLALQREELLQEEESHV